MLKEKGDAIVKGAWTLLETPIYILLISSRMLFTYLFVNFVIYLFICKFVHLFVNLFIYLFICI